MSGTIADWERDRFETATADEIAALPVTTEEPPTTESIDAPTPCVLLERSCGGWSTSLEWHPATGPTITVRQGFEATPYVFAVPEGVSPLEAFEHPYVYDPRGK